MNDSNYEDAILSCISLEGEGKERTFACWMCHTKKEAVPPAPDGWCRLISLPAARHDFSIWVICGGCDRRLTVLLRMLEIPFTHGGGRCAAVKKLEDGSREAETIHISRLVVFGYGHPLVSELDIWESTAR